MAERDTLGGWQNEEKVRWYLETAEINVVKRAESLAYLTQMLPWPTDHALNALELGCGFGAVTQEFLDRFPHATVTCIDGSEEMLKLARPRLAKYGQRVRFQQTNLATPDWSKGLPGSYDVAYSALALHHLTDERKAQLYAELFKLLRSGGVFVNNDMVTEPPALEKRFDYLYCEHIQTQERARRGLNRTVEEISGQMAESWEKVEKFRHFIAPLRSHLKWLDDAGFESVDCFWKYLDFSIIGGVKV